MDTWSSDHSVWYAVKYSGCLQFHYYYYLISIIIIIIWGMAEQ